MIAARQQRRDAPGAARQARKCFEEDFDGDGTSAPSEADADNPGDGDRQVPRLRSSRCSQPKSGIGGLEWSWRSRVCAVVVLTVRLPAAGDVPALPIEASAANMLTGTRSSR